MNKIVFALLLLLLGVGLLFPTVKFVLFLALIKVLLVAFFYMELLHAHVAWKLASTGLLLVTFAGLFLFI
ncbi:hypothetical protein [Bdellovibrio sp. BCCA]|uniref:hypothetical protein n=1 Tax=Bdellovibrio sp. BCCA TaxID=3136281 RepID=UPI0030F1143E